MVEKKKGQTAIAKQRRVALLSQGHFFGELALINDAPRACTCKAMVRSGFGVLSKDDYQALLMAGDQKALEAKKEILKSSSIFNSCSPKELTYISYFFKVSYFAFKKFITYGRQYVNSNLTLY